MIPSRPYRWAFLAASFVGLLWGAVAPSRAVELVGDLRFSGFYGVDATYSDGDLRLPAPGGRFTQYDEHSVNLRNSILGGQLDYDATDNLRITLQGSTYFNSQEDLTSRLDWAYASYDLGSDFRLRAGKFQIPMLQGTELKRIGFSRLWARPVEPNNGAGGFQYYYGLEVLKHLRSGKADWDFQIALGEPEHDLDDQVDGNDMALVAARYSAGNSWIRGALFHSGYDIDFPGGLAANSAEQWIYNVEAETRVHNLVINAGYSDADSEIFPEDRLGYFSLGYETGRVTPYVLLSHRLQRFSGGNRPPPSTGPGGAGPSPGPLMPPSPPPPGPHPPGDGPPVPPDGVNRANSIAIGARWFVANSVSVKFQLERTEVSDRSRANSGIVFEEEGNTFSIVLEGVF